jgi:hypothetical protein
MYGGSYPSIDRPSFIEIFDQEVKEWTKQPIEIPSDPLPLRHTRGSCCVLPSGDIYFYGGYIIGNTRLRKPCDHLYKLKTTRAQLELLKLSPGGDDKPMKKAGCQMVVFHKTKIALYGGETHVNLISSISPKQLSRTVSIGPGTNWQIVNELHVFDTLTGNLYPVVMYMALHTTGCALESYIVAIVTIRII